MPPGGGVPRRLLRTTDPTSVGRGPARSLRGYPGAALLLPQDGARLSAAGAAMRRASRDGLGPSAFFTMSAKQTVLENLAAAFLAGKWSTAGLAKRGAEAWGQREP